MSQKIEIDGKEVDVFTSEEVEAQKQAAIEKFKEENPDVSEDLKKLEDQIAVKEKELEGLRSKDMNFSTLRGQVDNLKKDLETKVAAAKKEVLEGVLQDHYNDSVKRLAGGDEELKKKIEFHYKRIADTAATKEDLNKKLTDAWVLATKVDSPDALNAAVISSGGVGRIQSRGGVQKFSAEEKVIGQKLAKAGGFVLEDKDFDKPINVSRGGTGTYEPI